MKFILPVFCVLALSGAPLLAAHAGDYDDAQATTQDGAGAAADAYDAQGSAETARNAAEQAQYRSDALGDDPDALRDAVKARQAAQDAQDAADDEPSHEAGMRDLPQLEPEPGSSSISDPQGDAPAPLTAQPPADAPLAQPGAADSSSSGDDN